MLDVSKTTIYRLCAADELRWILVGSQVRISEIGLANWIAEGGNAEHATKDWPMTPRLVVGR